MKKTFGMILLLVALVLPLSAFSAAEEEIYVYIPDSASKLKLPAEDAWYDGDPFLTGIEGAVAQVLWDTVSVRSASGGSIDVDYISKVIVDYPETGTIRKVVAAYCNDDRKSLTRYTITYHTGEDEYYAITYAPRTNTVLEDHVDGKIFYEDHGVITVINVDTGDTVTVDLDADLPSQKLLEDSLGAVYLHHYSRDEVLEGAYTDGEVKLKSGSGSSLDSWYLWDEWTGTVTRSRKIGLRPAGSFVSPRVN